MFLPIGVAEISDVALIILQNNDEPKRHLLAGICRNHFEMKKDPPLITSELINSDIEKEYNLPKTKKEKAMHLLKYMYNKGGDDLEKFNFYNYADRTITYSENPSEFNVIIRYLEDENYINIGRDRSMGADVMMYNDVMLTSYGIEKVQEDLPKIPMIGLVDQEISTGDIEVDEKINHAKKLFLDSESMDNKRSACENLSFILEPLRDHLKDHFSSKDINDFFQIVNNFDVRHNKDHTKSLEHPEQLEWVFYTLLNTINTYAKLKARLG